MKKLFILLLILPISAFAESPGWIVQCNAHHSLNDDPIVFPGQPGVSHLHDFVGNDETNANSTYMSMLTGNSNCGLAEDTAGYWVPAVYKNGVKINPSWTKVYYRSFYDQPVTVFPPDFRMIAGKATATSPSDNPKYGKEIYWGCSDNSTGKLTVPPNCATGTISLHVGFPGCWNGVDLDSANHRDHVAYPLSNGSCPSTHPVRISRVIIRYEYAVGTDSTGVNLASGPVYTAHGDFWNTWTQSKLVQLTNDCINAGINCGKFQ